MINFLLTQRNKKMQELQNQGVIYADIARYFETSPSAVAKILGKEPVRTKEEIKYSNSQMENLFKERDSLISKLDLHNNHYELYMNGFYFIPRNNTLAQTIADTHFGPKSDNIVYMALFEGGTLWKARNRLDLLNVKEVNTEIAKNNVDADAALERGKSHSKIMEMELYWELYANGFTIPEILAYIADTNESKISRAIRSAKEYGVKKHASTENVETLLLEGYKDNDIAILLDISPHTIKKIKDLLATPPKPKDYNRQKYIHYLHQEQGKTQTEIAELLDLTRATVINDLEMYLQYHPENSIGDGKRIRNSSHNTHSTAIESKKDEIIQMRIQGAGIAHIVKETRIKEHLVTQLIYEQESTPGTPLYEQTQILKKQIQELKKQGMTISEIAKILNRPWQSLKKYY